jgi:2-amino-4-hydroxy-6-hydroxymethyldihydropteridine diphosphokinase
MNQTLSQTHFVAIGANLPGLDGCSALATCEYSLRAVALLPYLRGATRSRWYSSAPVPATDQPRYINGIVRVEGEVTPEKLLADLQAIEAGAGRTRGKPNEARRLDLDIIDLGGLRRASPDPILPHPRAHTRAFVLLPLRDVAPNWTHPALQLPIATLLAALPPQDIHPV